jgi:hypothetical protein
MTKVTIEAYVKEPGKDAVKAGEREVNKPADIDEAVEMFSANEVLAGFWRSHVIDVQREIRSGTSSKGKVTTSKVNQLIQLARTEKLAGDPTRLNQLIELGVIES